MKARIAIAAVAVAATSLPMAAGAALPRVYDRPLDACTTAIENQFDRGEVTDTFHSRMEDGGHKIYANIVTRQLDGTRDFQRVTCETNRSGRTVVELSAADGRWVDRDQG